MPVRWHDIDLNNHVTNTRYIAWVLEAQPIAFHEQKQLQERDIIYRNETGLGDTVIATAGRSSEKNIFLHKLTSQETGKELVQAQTKWRLV